MARRDRLLQRRTTSGVGDLARLFAAWGGDRRRNPLRLKRAILSPQGRAVRCYSLSREPHTNHVGDQAFAKVRPVRSLLGTLQVPFTWRGTFWSLSQNRRYRWIGGARKHTRYGCLCGTAKDPDLWRCEPQFAGVRSWGYVGGGGLGAFAVQRPPCGNLERRHKTLLAGERVRLESRG